MNTNLTPKAMIYASEQHATQKRKTGEPYVTHPLEVSSIVRKYTKDDNLIAAAVLHDTIEDTSTTYAELKEKFNKEIADNVLALTNNKPKMNAIGKPKYLVDKMKKMTDGQLIIKLADRLHNVSSLKGTDPKFQKRTIRQTKEILTGLKNERSLNGKHKELVKRIEKLVEKL